MKPRPSILLWLLAANLLPLGATEPSASTISSVSTASSLPVSPSIATSSDHVLLHFILRQDQARNLAEIQQVMKDQRFWAEFPPEGIEVESWYVVMGLGHVITLRVPPARVREVNLALERAAWKIFHAEVYPAYDLKKVAEANRAKQKAEAAVVKP